MNCRIAEQHEYPEIYRQIYSPDLTQPLISAHLNKQSIPVDKRNDIRRSPFVQLQTLKYDHIKTVSDILNHSRTNAKYRPYLGQRSSTDVDYVWINYNEWIIASHGSTSFGYAIVPLYATLGDDAMQHILRQTELTTIVCFSAKEARHLLEKFVSSLKYIIIMRDSSEVSGLKELHKDRVKIYTFDEFLKVGRTSIKSKPKVKPTDLYMICYTSGSTGIPKGVMIAHQQIVDAAFAVMETMENKIINSESVHLSYLPFAHILEQLCLCLITLNGARMGFLTDSIEGLTTDAQALRPTIFVVVPRILNRIYESYKEKIQGSKLKTQMVQYLIKKKLKEQKLGKLNHQSTLDRMCFKKLRQKLGGRVCCLISGGAPLQREVLQFARAIFNGLVLEGYGATETSGILSLTLLGETETSIVGAISHGLEVRLMDIPDLDLIVSRDHRGEICVRGMRCTQGYYKSPDKTCELIDEEGWLHTGDVGEWIKTGALKVVDRVKSIFKLSQGEYIAPEKIEQVYQLHGFIDQILIDGGSKHAYPVAIVVPNFTKLRSQLASSNVISNLKALSDTDLCKSTQVRKFMIKELDKFEASKTLKGFEKPKALYLIDQPFTVENEFLTPTMKLARHKIRKFYAETIENLYRECNES